jgi:hypothetical protein
LIKLNACLVPPQKVVVEPVSEGFVATLTIGDKTYESTTQSSQKLAKTHVALMVLQERKIDVLRYRKIFHQTKDTTPQEEMNKLPGAKFTITQLKSSSKDRFFEGQLDLDGKVYVIQYPYHKDHRYVRHKLCSMLLRQAMMYNEHAWKAYESIRKTPEFVFGRRFIMQEQGLTEDYDLELKGAQVDNEPMPENAVCNQSGPMFQAVCAFLNTQGGSLYYGIHDKTTRIHGITVKNVDKLKQRLTGLLRTKITPAADHFVRIILHKLLIRKNPTIQELLADNDGDVDVEKAPLEYVRKLTDEVKELQKFMPMHTLEADNIYVLEILVNKGTQLYYCDNIPYRRHLAATCTMSPDQIRQVYFHEFESERK